MKPYVWYKIRRTDYDMIEVELLHFSCGCAVGVENVLISANSSEMGRIRRLLKQNKVVFEVLPFAGRASLLENVS